MYRLIFTILLFLSISIFTLTAVAQTGDGQTPAEEGVCDVLRDDGVTPGLYGLCVAYCEAEAHSDRVLRNYDRRATGPNDPPMPCLEVAVACPCWDSDQLAAASEIAAPNSCNVIEGFFSILSYGENDVVFLTLEPETCNYQGPEGTVLLITTLEEQAECQAGVDALVIADFGGTCD